MVNHVCDYANSMTPLCLQKISTEITFHCYLVWLLSLFLFKSFSGSDTHPRFKLFACKSNTYTRALHINSINPFIQVIITITTTTSRTSLLVCRLLISSWHSRTKVKMAAPQATLHLIDWKVNVLFINEIVGHFCSYWGVFCGGGWFLCSSLCNPDSTKTQPYLDPPSYLLHSTTPFHLLQLCSVTLLFF